LALSIFSCNPLPEQSPPPYFISFNWRLVNTTKGICCRKILAKTRHAAIAPMSRNAATKSEKRHSRAQFPNKILSATSFSAQSNLTKRLHSFSTRRRGQNDFMQFVCSSSARSSRRHAAIIADRVR
jgi:hypothetical protein